MADDSDTEKYRECPEHGCSLQLRTEELRAHLKWDHNRSDREIRRFVIS